MRILSDQRSYVGRPPHVHGGDAGCPIVFLMAPVIFALLVPGVYSATASTGLFGISALVWWESLQRTIHCRLKLKVEDDIKDYSQRLRAFSNCIKGKSK